MDGPPRRPLMPVLLVNFIGTLGYTIAIPFMVYLVSRFGGDAVMYGFVSATYSAFQFIGAPVLGRWSDRFGRRRVLLLSQAGTLLSWLIFAGALFLPANQILSLGALTMSLPLVLILLARAIDGLTGGNISVANAYVADISDDENRSSNFGKMGVASNLGMVLGPALASVLGATVLRELLPILVAAAIALLGLVFIAFRLPESKCLPDRHHQRHDAVASLGQETRDCVHSQKTQAHGAAELMRMRGVGYVVTLSFVIMAGFSFFYTAFPVNAVTRLDWTVTELGVFFAGLSALLVVVQGPVLSWLAPRVRDVVLIPVGLVFLAAGFVLMLFANHGLLAAAAALFALGNGLMWPSLVALVAKVASADLQGEVQGLTGSAGSLASIVGLASGGFVYEAIGAKTFLISAAFMAIAMLMSLRALRMPAVTSG